MRDAGSHQDIPDAPHDGLISLQNDVDLVVMVFDETVIVDVSCGGRVS
jgi:hypothetical protein